MNENLTNYNSKIVCYCRKLKKASTVEKCYSRDRVVHIATRNGSRNKATKVFHINHLLKLFPNFIFGDNRDSTSDTVFNAT